NADGDAGAGGRHAARDRGRRGGHRREPARYGAVHRPGDGRDPAGRGRDRGGLVAPLPSWRPGRERADERPRDRSGRRSRVPLEPRGGVARMRTLFLHPPSYDEFDGGAGSRSQSRRQARSSWYPTWLAHPASPAIDFVARSEFDFTIKEVAEGRPLSRVLGVSYRDGDVIRHTPERPKLENMDALPYVVDVYRRDLTIENYVIGYLRHPYVSL